MASIVLLGAFSSWVLLAPPQPIALVLDLMALPWLARLSLGVAVLINVGCSFVYEGWFHSRVARLVGVIAGSAGKRRRREGRVYEAL